MVARPGRAINDGRGAIDERKGIKMAEKKLQTAVKPKDIHEDSQCQLVFPTSDTDDTHTITQNQLLFEWRFGRQRIW